MALVVGPTHNHKTRNNVHLGVTSGACKDGFCSSTVHAWTMKQKMDQVI
jgi:hypothetical protein